MIEGRQGDIFEVWEAESFNLLVLFGHSGFNGLSADLSFNNGISLQGRRLPSRPGDDLDGTLQQLADNRGLIGFADSERASSPGARGLSDASLTAAMEKVYRVCREIGAKRVLTNGIHDIEVHGTDQAERDRRAHFGYRLAAQAGRIETVFVSKSDVFVRNCPS